MVKIPLFPKFNPRVTVTLRRAKWAATLEGVYSLLPLYVARWFDMNAGGAPPAVLFAALGLSLSVLLVLRTNSAYDRWWEARKLWGKLVNVSRNLVVKARVFAHPDSSELEAFATQVINFAPILRDHLRGGDPKLPPMPSTIPHQPGLHTLGIYRTIQNWYEQKRIDGDQLRILDSEAREFLEICGACERILKTPLTRSYRIFLRQGTWLYLLLLPWGITGQLTFWAIPLTIAQAYLFVAINEIALAIENPFGYDDDDLDLDSICVGIDKSIRDIIG